MALVFTRKLGEAFFVGDAKVILASRGNKNEIKVVVDAPKEVRIRRDDMKKGAA